MLKVDWIPILTYKLQEEEEEQETNHVHHVTGGIWPNSALIEGIQSGVLRRGKRVARDMMPAQTCMHLPAWQIIANFIARTGKPYHVTYIMSQFSNPHNWTVNGT